MRQGYILLHASSNVRPRPPLFSRMTSVRSPNLRRHFYRGPLDRHDMLREGLILARIAAALFAYPAALTTELRDIILEVAFPAGPTFFGVAAIENFRLDYGLPDS